MRSSGRALAAVLIAVAMGGALRAQAAGPTGPAAAYRLLLQREAALRVELDGALAAAAPANLLKRMRAITVEYEQLSRKYRTSGYSDNALWQGAVLAGDAFARFGYSVDRRTARRLLSDLAGRFPSSSLVAGITPYREQLNRATGPAARPAVTTAAKSAPATSTRPAPTATAKSAVATTGTSSTRSPTNTLTDLRRDLLPDTVRLTLLLDRETTFTSERLDSASRVQIDLRNTQVVQALKDTRLTYPDHIVRQVRVAPIDGGHTRLTLDLERGARFSVYPMYGPYRLIVDVERAAKPAAPAAPPALVATGGGDASRPATKAAPVKPAAVTTGTAPPPTTVATTATTTGARTAAATKPLPPAAGRAGYSLSRQLGLGAARIVIDPGHGGHDPGAQAGGLDEASLVLDIALRLERLLLDTPGVEAVLTRRSSEYVALEERTAIANRADADLFLSIHANASGNPSARGIETYFLSFATNPEAEAIAARENAASSRTMRNLNDIVKTITLNDKIDESRNFAMRVQSSLYAQLRKVNKQARSLGVKQAPFQVLVGATMPSILSEISFITNDREAELLKTDKYRQQIAAALFDGIMGYQQSLKTVRAVAEKARR
jgi:N-acetylmuramoyl-L-alanine amidase